MPVADATSKVAIIGASGFIGAAVRRAATRSGHPPPSSISGLRVGAIADLRDPGRAVTSWIGAHPTEFSDLVDRLAHAEVVVNAAGLAQPQSADGAELDAANGLLPGVIAEAAARGGARRLVHVSSAAVQGDRDPLDESRELSPFSPYSRSKALGERVVLEVGIRAPGEVVVYRPTSVQGADRGVTRALVRFCRRRAVPRCGTGDAPIPLALVDNVGAAIWHLTTPGGPTGTVLHPWEGMTIRLLFDCFGERPRFVPVPAWAARATLAPARQAGRLSPRVAAVVRRAALLTVGQGQEARALAAAGFQLPFGVAGYRALAVAVAGP